MSRTRDTLWAMGKRVFVLSDLHLGPGGPMTSFHEHVRLGRLLHSWLDDDALGELVLAGDVFDFLQVPGYDGFSVAKAEERFERVASNASTEHVLEALRALAGRPGLEVTVLAGNHDPELMLPAVRSAFERKLGRVGSVRWADDEPLVARDGGRLPLWGRAVHAPGASGHVERQAWIVHGDRWDPQNVFDRDEARRAATEGAAFSLPLGSHLVFEVLSQIIHSEQRRWVAELKPELPVVVPLLLAYAPRETAGYLRKHLKLPARMLVADLRARLRAGPTLGAADGLGEGSDEATLAERLATEVVAALAAPLQGVRELEREQVLGPLESYLERGAVDDVPGTLGPGSAIRDALVRAWLAAVRSRGRFDDWNGADATPEHAARIVPPTLGALIAGHTHAARMLGELRPRYFNSGTWMPVRTLEGELNDVLRLMDAPYEPVPCPGTYVRIELGDGPPEVTVERAP